MSLLCSVRAISSKKWPRRAVVQGSRLFEIENVLDGSNNGWTGPRERWTGAEERWTGAEKRRTGADNRRRRRAHRSDARNDADAWRGRAAKHGAPAGARQDTAGEILSDAGARPSITDRSLDERRSLRGRRRRSADMPQEGSGTSQAVRRTSSGACAGAAGDRPTCRRRDPGHRRPSAEQAQEPARPRAKASMTTHPSRLRRSEFSTAMVRASSRTDCLRKTQGEVMPTPGPCSALRACARSAPPRTRVPRAGRGAPLGDDLSRYDADLSLTLLVQGPAGLYGLRRLMRRGCNQRGRKRGRCPRHEARGTKPEARGRCPRHDARCTMHKTDLDWLGDYGEGFSFARTRRYREWAPAFHPGAHLARQRLEWIIEFDW